MDITCDIKKPQQKYPIIDYCGGALTTFTRSKPRHFLRNHIEAKLQTTHHNIECISFDNKIKQYINIKHMFLPILCLFILKHKESKEAAIKMAKLLAYYITKKIQEQQ